MGLFDIKAAFDHVDLLDADGNVIKRLTPKQYSSERDFPINERVTAMLQRRLRFYRGERVITMREALGDL